MRDTLILVCAHGSDHRAPAAGRRRRRRRRRRKRRRRELSKDLMQTSRRTR